MGENKFPQKPSCLSRSNGEFSVATLGVASEYTNVQRAVMSGLFYLPQARRRNLQVHSVIFIRSRFEPWRC